MGADVRFYTPKDTVYWNDIPIITYPDKTVYNVGAAEIELSHTDILYVKENAPTTFDIRFGPLNEHHDILFYGGFGLKSRYGPYEFDADLIVQSNDLTYFKENEDLTLIRGDYLVEDTRE